MSVTSNTSPAQHQQDIPTGSVAVAVERISKRLDDACRAVTAITLVALVVTTFVGVLFRYVLNDALTWTGEAGQLTLAWLVFLAATVLFRQQGHPGITVLVDRLRPRVRAVAVFARDVCVGAYLGALFSTGLGVVFAGHPARTVALHLPFAALYAAVPVSAAVMIVHWLAHLAHARENRGRTVIACVVVTVVVTGVLTALPTGAGGALYGLPQGVLWCLLPVLFALGVPIAFVLGLFAMTMLAFTGAVPLSIATDRLYDGIDNPSFLAIPALMLTGSLMLHTGMAEKLITLATAVVGRIRGGLALADVVASVIFADISGSAVADTAAVGSVMMPGMRKRGYSSEFATAHQAACGAVGTLFPPSISMILFATAASVSVTALFLSSVIPGIFLALLFMLLAYAIATKRKYPKEAKMAPAEVGKAVVQALPAVAAVAVVLGGILAGVFSASEAGAVAAVYVFVVGFVSLRRRGLRHGLTALFDAANTTAMVMFIIANASLMAWMMISFRLPQAVVDTIGSVTTNPYAVTVLACLLLIALAMFLEPPAILIGVVPIVLPLVKAVGVDPIHFGVIVMLTTTIGMLLPPIGVALLVASGILHTPVERAARAAVPYVALATLTLLLVIFFPGTIDLLQP